MKFLKIGLIAALGITATTSFAADLSSAIKGIDVEGSIRYRFSGDTIKNEDFDPKNTYSTSKHEWRGLLTFKSPVTDGFQGVIGTRYDSRSYTGATLPNNTPELGMTDATGNRKNASLLEVREIYGVYTLPNTKTSLQIGKQKLDTPITNPDDDRATGALLLSQDINNITLAIGGFDTWYSDTLLDGVEKRKDLYAAAIIGSFGDIGAQLWGFSVKDMVDYLVFAELSYNKEISKAMNLGLKAQYFHNELDDKTFNKDQFERSINLFALQASLAYNALSGSLGYIGSGDEGYFVTMDTSGSMIMAGEEWYNFSYNGSQIAPKNGKAKLDAFLATLAYDVTDKLMVGIDYVYAEGKMNDGKVGSNDEKIKTTEIVPRVGYKLTKNLKLSSYYSFKRLDSDAANDDDKMDRIRVEAKYSF